MPNYVSNKTTFLFQVTESSKPDTSDCEGVLRELRLKLQHYQEENHKYQAIITDVSALELILVFNNN